jgi:hypothetical protein
MMHLPEQDCITFPLEPIWFKEISEDFVEHDWKHVIFIKNKTLIKYGQWKLQRFTMDTLPTDA